MPSGPSLQDVQRLDEADPLRLFRDRFALPDGLIYLDGNSLGPLPRQTPERVADVVAREWGQGLIASWNTAGWIDAPTRIGARIAPLIGAAADEVLAGDSTSANLFKLLAAAVAAQPADRRVILTEAGNFPTDLYMAQGLASVLPGVEVRALPRADIVGALSGKTSEETAVLLLTHVHYKTGETYDMAAVTALAHAAGALTLWDLSHSAGAVAVDLEGAGADLAVGCGYKYLNGGPGAPAWLYVRRALQDRLRSPLSGWLGHAEPFAFSDSYRPAPGVRRFICGTPSILGLAALESGLDAMADADLPTLFAKSQRLCDLFIAAVEARCADGGLSLVTPCEGPRGAQVSFRHVHAYPVVQALIERGVVGDFRAPDILRFGFPGLFLRFEDAWRAAQVLGEVLDSGLWREPRFQVRAAVT